MTFDPETSLTPAQKLLNVKKKINELKRNIEKADHRDMQSDHILTQRQARAILRAALAELETLL